jgi:hypothetical protein
VNLERDDPHLGLLRAFVLAGDHNPAELAGPPQVHHVEDGDGELLLCEECIWFQIRLAFAA